MRTPANIAGHPIHPMLVTIPIGLWIFSLVADLVALRSSSPEDWALVACLPLALSVRAVAMLLVSAWLGGKMVYLAGIGVSAEQREQERRHA